MRGTLALGALTGVVYTMGPSARSALWLEWREFHCSAS